MRFVYLVENPCFILVEMIVLEKNSPRMFSDAVEISFMRPVFCFQLFGSLQRALVMMLEFPGKTHRCLLVS